MTSKKLKFNDGIYEYTFEEVFEKYRPFIKKRALLVQTRYPNMMSFEDALSNCNYGFWQAYEDYDHEKESSFLSYAALCMWRYSVRGYTSKKRTHGKEADVADCEFLLEFSDFEDEIYYKIMHEEVLRFMENGGISRMQWKVMKEYISGKDYKQIQQSLGMTSNQVRGAINLARKTLRKRFPDIFN